MPGNIPAANLLQETPSVEVVEEAAHRRSFTLAPPSPASQENPTTGFVLTGELTVNREAV